MPFEQKAMRHIAVLILNMMGMLRVRGRGAKKFQIGPSSKWKVYKYTSMSHFVCTCKNVHAWYFCRFDPACLDDEITAAFPEDAGVPETFQPE